ncbi:hypothetical protein [Cellulophaga fucicola]|uniref:hypothetical protein n=1 Tax=Cellulophaga fucicola TaxID=76595 RepID=UPI003EB9FB52
MKKLLCALVCGLLLVSCSSDDDNTTKTLEEKIAEDSWYFQRHGETCSNDFDLQEGGLFELRFLPDNTLEFTEPGYLTSSSYMLNGEELTVTTVYTLPSGSTREFVGNYEYSAETDSFTGNNTFTAYRDTETLWTCQGTASIFGKQ